MPRQKMPVPMKRLRLRVGLKQHAVAQYLGVCRPTVARWESGRAVPSLRLLASLARLYQVTADELLQSLAFAQAQFQWRQRVAAQQGEKPCNIPSST